MTKTKAENKQSRKKKERSRKGPEPERIKFDGNWEDAVDIALKAKRPATGWPK